MEAVSEEAAMSKLKGEGSIVLELSEAFDIDNASWNITIGNPVKKKDITIFCKQFYSILTAGVTVIDGLRMVQDQTENKYLREALYRVMVNVEKGDSLADALEMESKIFPSLLIHMVAAGEATGNLEIAFDRICTQFDKDMKLHLFNQIKINNFSEKVFIFSFPPYSLLPESLSMIQELPHP